MLVLNPNAILSLLVNQPVCRLFCGFQKERVARVAIYRHPPKNHLPGVKNNRIRRFMMIPRINSALGGAVLEQVFGASKGKRFPMGVSGH
ncbi:hypothetical protein [Anaerolinea sp.]|uniref:hypothetical protein n=1 Tax=Anaerolinea sp. TaxID=1872519 RepID=UPI002ACDDDEA|nr:hypothetical protein [Anaerolinea sp.]